MTFDQINSFYLVATLGTFQQAADRLNATQPAISARIATLESRLGVKLFDRSGHRVALTPHGRQFMVYAEKMLELRTLAELNVGRGGDVGGVIRIGASDTMAGSWMPDFLTGLSGQFPMATFEIQVGPSPRLRDELIAHQLDVGFIVGPVTSPELISQPICQCPMVLTAAPSLGLHGRRVHVHELEEVNILTFERMTQPHQMLRRDLRARGISARLNPISSLSTAVLLACKGLGVAALPLVAVEREIENGQLCRLEAELELSTLQFAVCYRGGPELPAISAIVDSALDFLKARGSSESIKIIY